MERIACSIILDITDFHSFSFQLLHICFAPVTVFVFFQNVFEVTKKYLYYFQQVEGVFYVNDSLEKLMMDELRQSCRSGGYGGFLPGVKQIANVAALPGIVGRSIGLPDVHSGYGFAIGNMAAFDVNDPLSVVSPGGVGFDINCGVRLLRTNLTEKDVLPLKEQLAQSMFDHIPVGVGSKGIIPMGVKFVFCSILFT